MENKRETSLKIVYAASIKLECLKLVIRADPEIMGDMPVFVRTRVPLQNLIDYLEGGESIDAFLD